MGMTNIAICFDHGSFGGQVRSACLQQAGRMTSGRRSRHKRASLVSSGLSLILWKFRVRPNGGDTALSDE